jgi:hypothetical protein
MARKALLCGINAYSSIPLRGCVNDARNMQRLLVDHYGFATDNVHLLLDHDCVKNIIMDHWRWLTADTSPGDLLVFHISAHGSYIADPMGEEEDLRDEITCLQNFDFDDPSSYISDNDWYQLTQAVDPNVHLLMVKDTCHSGGSSRFISVRQSSGIDKIILADSHQLNIYQAGAVIAEQEVSNARFIVPPQIPAEAWQHEGTSRKAARRSGLMHTHLMACGEAQTAADAFIDGDYNGAFTHALCAVMREGSTSTSNSLINEVALRLRSRYSQVPQHEGESLSLTLMASSSSPQPVPMAFSTPLTTRLDNPSPLTPQQMVYEAHLKFLETMRLLHGQDPAQTRQNRMGTHVLVTVHGIGKHQHGYSDPWWSSLKPHIGDLFQMADHRQGRAEVLWSDLVNHHSRTTAPQLDQEAQQLRQAILDVLDDRRLQQSTDPTRLINEEELSRGVAFSVDDFLVYMLNADMRRRILERFTVVVRPLLATGSTLDLISHSWGTVVAYEGLRELEQDSGLTGRVANWFTVGSALSIPPVQATLRPANRPKQSIPGPCPALVDRWINLDAKGDLVGGALRHRFMVSREYLNLEPSGCTASWKGYELGCSHGSYFQPSNTHVNRDIFAAHILGLARPS